MASIRKRGVNWQTVWSVTTEGRRQQLTKTFATKGEARAHAEQVERLHEARGVAPQENPTVAELAAQYLAWCAPRLRASTLDGYRRNLGFLLRQIGSLRARQVTAQHLDAAYVALAANGGHNGRTLAPRTIRHAHRVTHAMFKQAERWRLVADNPARLTEPVKVPFQRAKPYTMAQVEALVAAAGPSPWPEIVYLAAATGLRRGELLGTPWSALDLDAGWLEVAQVVEQAGRYYGLRPLPKTRSSARRIGLDPDLCAMLKTWRARLAEKVLALGLSWGEATLCFPDLSTGDTGAPLQPNMVSARLRNIAKRIGVPSGIAAMHGLRHRHASSLMTLPIRQVADRLGHSTPSITLALYQHGDTDTARTTADAAGAAFGGLAALLPGRLTKPK